MSRKFLFNIDEVNGQSKYQIYVLFHTTYDMHQLVTDSSPCDSTICFAVSSPNYLFSTSFPHGTPAVVWEVISINSDVVWLLIPRSKTKNAMTSHYQLAEYGLLFTFVNIWEIKRKLSCTVCTSFDETLQLLDLFGFFQILTLLVV